MCQLQMSSQLSSLSVYVVLTQVHGEALAWLILIMPYGHGTGGYLHLVFISTCFMD